MSRMLLSVLSLTAVGCISPAETCVTEVDEVDVCIEFHETVQQCEREFGGTAYSSQDGAYLCDEELGYEVRCDGMVSYQDGNYTAEYAYYTASEEDCTATDGGTIGELATE